MQQQVCVYVMRCFNFMLTTSRLFIEMGIYAANIPHPTYIHTYILIPHPHTHTAAAALQEKISAKRHVTNDYIKACTPSPSFVTALTQSVLTSTSTSSNIHSSSGEEGGGLYTFVGPNVNQLDLQKIIEIYR